jgi:hypothetical protein
MKCIAWVILTFVLVSVCHCPAQTVQGHNTQSNPRIGLSGGMGVSYVSAQDVVDLVNANGGQTERVSEFKAGAEFFCTVTIPVSVDWGLKVEYAYLIFSFNQSFPSLGASEFTAVVHMPTVLGQYTLVDEGTYNVKAGAGIGYHFGSLTERYSNLDDMYTGRGLGAALDLEANTAFGESFYGYLGGILRWDFVGTLTNEAGRSAKLVSMSSDPTLEFFSVGARLGFTYYF